ncbi:hypothetical protein [Actinoplanes cyaneus]|nr:hypothetical protein [Actinoplanes cyaneus]MCW2143897.1 hypothetical protein [Actinoplanes cyaneus]
MAVNRLVLAELKRHDWSRLQCGCGGTAEHVPSLLLGIVEATEDTASEVPTLEGHIEVEGNLFESAVPAVGVILAALAGDLAVDSRLEFLLTLTRLAGGDSHHLEVARGRPSLGGECRSRMSEGIWILLKEAFGSDRDLVADIMELIDPDDGRRAYYSQIAASTKKPRHDSVPLS